MSAAANHALEFITHGNEVGDFAFDLSLMSTGDGIDRLARLIAVVGEREQVAHGLQAEPQARARLMKESRCKCAAS